VSLVTIEEALRPKRGGSAATVESQGRAATNQRGLRHGFAAADGPSIVKS